ncbi:MAG: tryptophan--tRNA ligase [Patescibacteria group bacterium]|jgi:tryptophanyl-tRNA synthetase
MSKFLTAIQPSGLLHLGNYIGAIEPAVESQRGNELRMFVVDYHAITVPQKPEELRKNILLATATYLACGIDPKKTILFQQSRVPQHAELAWILNCTARMGELERMTQYKDKARTRGETTTVGLFDYPVLMAADILLYDTAIVPVGEDQKQHVELARDLAIRFNRDFGETFVVPQPKIREVGARIMGLDDPTKKMSKSASNPKNYISLMDDTETVRKKIMSAATDSEGLVAFDEKRPGIANLMTIYTAVAKKDNENMERLEAEYDGKGYGEFKKDLAEKINEFLVPLQAKIRTNLKNEKALIKILEAGSKRAAKEAEKKMELVRKRIGIKL